MINNTMKFVMTKTVQLVKYRFFRYSLWMVLITKTIYIFLNIVLLFRFSTVLIQYSRMYKSNG